VVVDDGEVPVPEVPVGRSAAQALRAAFTVGFEVSLALGNVVPVVPVVPELDGPPGKATP
jgi:hypothetical protein